MGEIDRALDWFSRVRPRSFWMLGLATLNTAYASYVGALRSPFWDRRLSLAIIGIIDGSFEKLLALVECSLPLMIALLVGDRVGL